MVYIDYTEAYNTAVHIVGESGEDYCADGCVYVARVERVDAIHGPRAELVSVCIVGEILEAIGVPLEDMEGMGTLAHYRHRFHHDKGIIFTDKAFYFLDSAQSMQDGDLSWGLSVLHAERLTSRREWTEEEGFTAF